MIKLLILGPTGNTSKLISRFAIEDDEIEVVAACDISHIDEKTCLCHHSLDKLKEHVEKQTIQTSFSYFRFFEVLLLCQQESPDYCLGGLLLHNF